MKVVADLGLCQGHAQCEDAAPEVFEVRDDGFVHLLRDEVDGECLRKAEEAAYRCPAEAIKLIP